MSPPSFNYDEIAGRLRGVAILLGGILSSKESAEVEHFIEHGEYGEALTTLAWLIVEEHKEVPREARMTIKDLAKQMAIEEELPESLLR